MRQSACLVINPITVDSFSSLFNCTLVGLPRRLMSDYFSHLLLENRRFYTMISIISFTFFVLQLMLYDGRRHTTLIVKQKMATPNVTRKFSLLRLSDVCQQLTPVFMSRMSCKTISIFHGCMVWIEKSVTRVTDRHHEACRVMPNSDPE